VKPNTTPAPPGSPEAVVTVLQRAYENRSLAQLGPILAVNPARNAVFHFYLSDPTPQGEVEWDHDEEVRIHSRMFRPEDHVRDPTPVPEGLWLSSISIHLTQLEPFAERTDLYSADQGKDGKLDPAIWMAVGARYGTDVFFDTQGEVNTDFQVAATTYFVVIEDRTKHVGDRGKFLLYLWDDRQPQPKPDTRGMPVGASKTQSWSSVKDLYR
jgi:hypothetical protein